MVSNLHQELMDRTAHTERHGCCVRHLRDSLAYFRAERDAILPGDRSRFKAAQAVKASRDARRVLMAQETSCDAK